MLEVGLIRQRLFNRIYSEVGQMVIIPGTTHGEVDTMEVQVVQDHLFITPLQNILSTAGASSTGGNGGDGGTGFTGGGAGGSGGSPGNVVVTLSSATTINVSSY